MNIQVAHTRLRTPTRLDAAGKALRPLAGLLLVGLGLAGMILPIIPGLPLLVAGAVLVAPNHRVVRAVRERLEAWRHRRNLVGLMVSVESHALIAWASRVPVNLPVMHAVAFRRSRKQP
jgi:uncharacterized membrane protein YbaN (DUF454 family)